MTVKEARDKLTKLIKEGYGDTEIMVAEDCDLFEIDWIDFVAEEGRIVIMPNT